MGRSSVSALSKEARQLYNDLVNNKGAVYYPDMVNPVRIEGDTATIYCYSKGKIMEALIDTEDLHKISIRRAISIVNRGKGGADAFYCRVGNPIKGNKAEDVKGNTIHRIVTSCPADMVVDHVNHNSLDNRKSNLAVMSQEENLINKKVFSTNKTGTKNILYKNGYYQLHISRGFINREYAEEALEKIYDIIQHYCALDAREKADKRINGA
jgi:hypothetical protein